MTKEMGQRLKEEMSCNTVSTADNIGGGCTNQAYVYDTDRGKFFVKVSVRICNLFNISFPST